MAQGIYIIKNLVNGKYYIGSSININKRFREHKSSLRNNKHHSIKLQRSWNKYGCDIFIFEVIQYCERENLISNEQYWIDHYDSYNNRYNSTKEAVASKQNNQKRKGIPLTEQHKQAIRDSKKNISLETREKIRIANTGKKHSQETKIKFSKIRKGVIPNNVKPILQFDLNNKLIKEWPSIKYAAKETNSNASTISLNNLKLMP
jgi:group I intron endonuclease